MNLLLLITISFAISACATSGPEPSRSETVQAMESGGDELWVHDSPAESIQGIEELKAPNVSETPAAMIPRSAMAEPSIICERESPTGSRIAVKVCHYRSDVLQRQEVDQKTLRDLQNLEAIRGYAF